MFLGVRFALICPTLFCSGTFYNLRVAYAWHAFLLTFIQLMFLDQTAVFNCLTYLILGICNFLQNILEEY